MSFEALAWAIRQKIKAPEKSVLLMLAYRDNPDPPHGCYPSLERMASDTGLDRSCVARCASSLIERGLVGRTKRFDDEGRQRSSYYFFPQLRGGVASKDMGVANSDPEGRRQRRGRVANSTTEPKRENPKEEPKTRRETRAARNRIDDEIERRRRTDARRERETREEIVRREAAVGDGGR